MSGAQFHQYCQGHLIIPDTGRHYQGCRVYTECDFPYWAALVSKVNRMMSCLSMWFKHGQWTALGHGGMGKEREECNGVLPPLPTHLTERISSGFCIDSMEFKRESFDL